MDDISKVKPGYTFSYGFFNNVAITEITQSEIVFQDKFCNERRLKIHDFLTSATNIKPGQPIPQKEVKEEVMFDKKTVKNPVKVEAEKTKAAKKTVQKPQPKELKKSTPIQPNDLPKGWITAADADRKYHKSRPQIVKAVQAKKIEGKRLAVDGRKAQWCVKEEDMAKAFPKK